MNYGFFLLITLKAQMSMVNINDYEIYNVIYIVWVSVVSQEVLRNEAVNASNWQSRDALLLLKWCYLWSSQFSEEVQKHQLVVLGKYGAYSMYNFLVICVPNKMKIRQWFVNWNFSFVWNQWYVTAKKLQMKERFLPLSETPRNWNCASKRQ